MEELSRTVTRLWAFPGRMTDLIAVPAGHGSGIAWFGAYIGSISRLVTGKLILHSFARCPS
jgi:hypothetical protein